MFDRGQPSLAPRHPKSVSAATNIICAKTPRESCLGAGATRFRSHRSGGGTVRTLQRLTSVHVMTGVLCDILTPTLAFVTVFDGIRMYPEAISNPDLTLIGVVGMQNAKLSGVDRVVHLSIVAMMIFIR